MTRPATRKRGAVHGPVVATHRRRRPLVSLAPPLGSLIWSSRSQITAGTGRSVERGDHKKVGRKVCAQLALSISLSSERLRLPSIDRRPKAGARRADRGPYSLIVFGTGGRWPPLFAHNAHSYGGGSSVTRREGDDAAHDLETADRQGPHGPVAQHDLSPRFPRHLSRPRAPRGPCRGLDRGRGAHVAHRADRATPADRAHGIGSSSHDPSQDGGPSMTPRHTTLAPVADGGVRAVGHGRGHGRIAARPTAGAPRQERRTADTDDGYRARGCTSRPTEKGWST